MASFQLLSDENWVWIVTTLVHLNQNGDTSVSLEIMHIACKYIEHDNLTHRVWVVWTVAYNVHDWQKAYTENNTGSLTELYL